MYPGTLIHTPYTQGAVHLATSKATPGELLVKLQPHYHITHFMGVPLEGMGPPGIEGLCIRQYPEKLCEDISVRAIDEMLSNYRIERDRDSLQGTMRLFNAGKYITRIRDAPLTSKRPKTRKKEAQRRQREWNELLHALIKAHVASW